MVSNGVLECHNQGLEPFRIVTFDRLFDDYCLKHIPLAKLRWTLISLVDQLI